MWKFRSLTSSISWSWVARMIVMFWSRSLSSFGGFRAVAARFSLKLRSAFVAAREERDVWRPGEEIQA